MQKKPEMKWNPEYIELFQVQGTIGAQTTTNNGESNAEGSGI